MGDSGGRHAQYAEAKAAAVKLLASRPRTREDLQGRLKRKGLPREAIDEALDDLESAGYVDDEQYARDRVEDLLRKSKRGAPALVHALAKDGLGREVAERIVAERLADVDMGQWALEVALERGGHVRGEDDETARRRLYGYLRRRGFADAVALRAIDEALTAEDT